MSRPSGPGQDGPHHSDAGKRRVGSEAGANPAGPEAGANPLDPEASERRDRAVRVAWWRRGPAIAVLSLLVGWVYLAVAVNLSLAWAGDPGGLPLAAWLLPLAGSIGPWVFTPPGPRVAAGTDSGGSGTGAGSRGAVGTGSGTGARADVRAGEVSARRGHRAGLGVLGCLLAVGVMIFSPLVGALLALAWVVAINLVG